MQFTSKLLEHHETSMYFSAKVVGYLNLLFFQVSIFMLFYRFNLASSLTIKGSGKVQWENGAYANVKPIQRLIFSKHG